MSFRGLKGNQFNKMGKAHNIYYNSIFQEQHISSHDYHVYFVDGSTKVV